MLAFRLRACVGLVIWLDGFRSGLKVGVVYPGSVLLTEPLIVRRQFRWAFERILEYLATPKKRIYKNI